MEKEDDIPSSEERRIPKWILFTAVCIFLWGIIGFFLYWNGSHGWCDRGCWQQLQQSAKTRF